MLVHFSDKNTHVPSTCILFFKWYEKYKKSNTANPNKYLIIINFLTLELNNLHYLYSRELISIQYLKELLVP